VYEGPDFADGLMSLAKRRRITAADLTGLRMLLRCWEWQDGAAVLNTHWFMSLDDGRRKCEAWRRDYNEERPHSAIGNKVPVELIGRQRHKARADWSYLERGQQPGPGWGSSS
jgi:transposase InsO family protein